MKGVGLLFGGLLALLGVVLTYEGWFAPRVGDGFGQLIPWMIGPPALLIGIVLLVACYPYTRASDDVDDIEDKDIT